jgi:iron complex transport system permease protein
VVWAAVWVVVAAAGVLAGSQNVWAWDEAARRADVLRMRAYAVLAASAVGAALAVSGLALQALLRNPLASPYILGVSGGASLGVICSSLFLSVALAPVFGFAGAILTVGVVWAVAQRRGRIEPYTLLLSGVIINSFYAAAIMLVAALARPEDRGDIAWWMMGDIDPFDPRWGHLLATGALALVAAGVAQGLAKAFNLVAMGEETAGALGVRVERVRLATFVAASVATGAAVALVGPIGFVGLIVPHLLRMLLGPDHRTLVPAVLFGGAAFLAGADLVTRLLQPVVAPFPPPPVGVLTAMCGGPFFIYLLRARWRKRMAIQ